MQLIFVYDEFDLLESMHTYKEDEYIIISDIMYGMVTQIYQLRIAGYNIQIVAEKQEVVLSYNRETHKIQYLNGRFYHNQQQVSASQRTVDNSELNLTDVVLRPNNLISLRAAFNSLIKRVTNGPEVFTVCITNVDLLRQVTPYLWKDTRILLYSSNINIHNDPNRYYDMLISFEMAETIKQRCYRVFNFRPQRVNGTQVKEFLLKNQKMLKFRPDYCINNGFVKKLNQENHSGFTPDAILDIENVDNSYGVSENIWED